MSDTIIENAFGALYGEPCWNVKSGYGSSMTLEFGHPKLEIYEPHVPIKTVSSKVARFMTRRQITVHGAWHLWLFGCEWQVITNGKRIGHSNLKGSSKLPIKKVAEELDGQKLMRVSLDPSNFSMVFEFDLGCRLETRPYDQTLDQWHLYEPFGSVLTLRGDGRYSYGPGDTRPDEIVWIHYRTLFFDIV